MPTFQENLATLRASAAYKSASPAEQSAAELAYTQKVRGDAMASKTQDLQAGQERGGMLASAAQGTVAAVQGLGQSAGLGYVPQIASQIPGAPSAPELQGQEDAYAAQYPKLYNAGRFAGNFVGPVAKAAGIVGGAIAKPLGALANAAVAPLESEFGKRLLVNLVQNAAGGATAVAGTEFARARDQFDLTQRLSDAANAVGDMSKNPASLAMLAGGSLAQAAMSRPPSAELATMRDRYERVSGQKVPLEVLTDSADQRAAYDALARVPGVQDRISQQKTAAIQGLQSVLEDIRGNAGAAGGGREALRGQAADAVKTVVGDQAPSPITAQRRGAMSNALATDVNASSVATNILVSAVRDIRDARPRLAKSQMDPVFDEIEKLADRGAGLTARDLEELRQQVSGLAKFAKNPVNEVGARAGTRTDAEAGQLYGAIQEAAQRTAPNYANALNLSQTLHRMEDALGDVPITRVDDAQAAGFFNQGKSGDFPSRWQALNQSAAPQDIAALKGWYWYRFVRSVANGRNNTISSETLDKMTSREGPFNSQIVNTVVPGALDELRQYAKFSEKLFGKGRFGPEGSSTAGRVAQYGTQMATGSAAAAAAHFIGAFSNPFSATVGVLGPIAVRAVLRSALGGILESHFQKTVRNGSTPFTNSARGAQTALQGVPSPIGLPPRPQILSSLPQVGTQETP